MCQDRLLRVSTMPSVTLFVQLRSTRHISVWVSRLSVLSVLSVSPGGGGGRMLTW